MALSRREFLKTAGTFAVVGGMPLSLADIALAKQAHTASPLAAGAQIPLLGQRLVDPLSSFTMATFTEIVNTKFRVRGKHGDAKLTLVQVEGLPPSEATSPHQECFSLLFRDAHRRPLPQETYRVDHPKLGAFDLFLVPMANNGGPRDHVAIINRRLS